MRTLGAALIVLTALCLNAPPAAGSGDPGPYAVLIDRKGGSPAERDQLYRGQMGVLHTSASEQLLFLQWRLLNGLEVGSAAGATLSARCCDRPVSNGLHDGVFAWIEATRLVPGTPPPELYIATERPGPNYSWIPNCYRDAFNTAATTLRNRVARFGARAPAVQAWMRTQNAVFDACSEPDATLPRPMANSPAWLRRDRAYQEAAFALYKGDNQGAANRFADIARDAASPWQSKGTYLRARALHRAALALGTPASLAAARASIGQLAAARSGTFGQEEIPGMLHALAFRDRPDQIFVEVERDLHAKILTPDVAKSLRDYLTLAATRTSRPDIADWIATLQASKRHEALAHARGRWTATRNTAWLVAALSLTQTADPDAAALARDAALVTASNPAWLSAQYHQMRLTLASADAMSMRRRVDAILARDLTGSDRNVFLALRSQVAANLVDLMRYAKRTPYCSDEQSYCSGNSWARKEGSYGRDRRTGRYAALGPDVKALLDRLPLRERMAAAKLGGLPSELQLDIALTNFGRAVQLQDDPAIDRLAGDLASLLPQMRRDWLAVRGTPRGTAKRFAEFLILAKIPGVSPDLIGFIYARPQGTVRQFQGQWWDWMILPAGETAGPVEPPNPANYRERIYSADGVYSETAPEDLNCYGHCGAGTSPLRIPEFVAAEQHRAATERAKFVFRGDYERFLPDHRGEQQQRTFPAGTLSAWEELFAYAQANPREARAPEALYWLIRISRRGHIHGRLGYRAFRLLHTRYRGSSWTKRSPYYFD